jgi:hypothetical protein
MSNESKSLTKKDAWTFFVCFTIIFFLIVIPKINYSDFALQIRHLISFNSDSYNYENPPIFFSIGEAISALAILFAVYQFKKEKWSLALKIRSYIQTVIITSISLGIIFSIISSLTSFIVPKNIFELSIFWQISSSFFIAFSIVFLISIRKEHF